MRLITIQQFLSGLCSIPEKDFQIGTGFAYVKEHPVDEASLEPYLFFSKGRITS